MKYAKIELKNGRQFFLKDIVETDRFIKGIRVNREGEQIGTMKVLCNIELSEKDAIAKITPMRMNLKYAELEKAKEQDGERRKK